MSPARWYTALNPWDASDDFYFDLIMQASSVTDVGCGTGTLLHRARDGGHVGHLRGVDPDPEMIALARTRSDIEWTLGSAADVTAGNRDLVTMTGHAFQTLATNDELTRSLRAIRGALAPDGRFAFETRNPTAEAWTYWNGQETVTDAGGEQMTLVRRVTEVANGTVTFSETFLTDGMDTTVSTTLRFLDRAELASVLTSAGFVVERQFGNWDRAPLDDDSPEIITIAALDPFI